MSHHYESCHAEQSPFKIRESTCWRWQLRCDRCVHRHLCHFCLGRNEVGRLCIDAGLSNHFVAGWRTVCWEFWCYWYAGGKMGLVLLNYLCWDKYRFGSCFLMHRAWFNRFQRSPSWLGIRQDHNCYSWHVRVNQRCLNVRTSNSSWVHHFDPTLAIFSYLIEYFHFYLLSQERKDFHFLCMGTRQPSLLASIHLHLCGQVVHGCHRLNVFHITSSSGLVSLLRLELSGKSTCLCNADCKVLGGGNQSVFM